MRRYFVAAIIIAIVAFSAIEHTGLQRHGPPLGRHSRRVLHQPRKRGRQSNGCDFSHPCRGQCLVHAEHCRYQPVLHGLHQRHVDRGKRQERGVLPPGHRQRRHRHDVLVDQRQQSA